MNLFQPGGASQSMIERKMATTPKAAAAAMAWTTNAQTTTTSDKASKTPVAHLARTS